MKKTYGILLVFLLAPPTQARTKEELRAHLLAPERRYARIIKDIAPADEETVKKWLALIPSDDGEVRREAQAALRAMGPGVLLSPAIQKASIEGSAETKLQIRSLVAAYGDAFTTSPEKFIECFTAKWTSQEHGVQARKLLSQLAPQVTDRDRKILKELDLHISEVYKQAVADKARAREVNQDLSRDLEDVADSVKKHLRNFGFSNSQKRTKIRPIDNHGELLGVPTEIRFKTQKGKEEFMVQIAAGRLSIISTFPLSTSECLDFSETRKEPVLPKYFDPKKSTADFQITQEFVWNLEDVVEANYGMMNEGEITHQNNATTVVNEVFREFFIDPPDSLRIWKAAKVAGANNHVFPLHPK